MSVIVGSSRGAQAIEVEPGASAPTRRAWVEQIMGMPISIHVRGPEARRDATADCVARAFDALRAVDARFSTYRPDSELSRLRRGQLDLTTVSPDMREVERLCRTALERTDGYFDAWGWTDGFDPTGLVKGWAIARAGDLLADLMDLDVAVNAGGDLLVRVADAAPDPWMIGIEDPRDRATMLARVPVREGAVATSGSAARGSHIRDPFRSTDADEVLSATVVGPSMLWADVCATASVARGTGAVEWTPGLAGTSGLLVLADGIVHRWANPG